MTLGTAIRWRSESNAIDDWRLLRPAPAENLGFTEAQRYVLQKPCTDCTFYVDDAPLPDHPNGPSCWIWEPRFFAGEVTAEMVTADGTNSILFLVDVAPDENKVGRESFRQMVNELWQEDPTLVIGSEPATTPSGELGSHEDPWAAFARLRQYGPDFVRALAAVRARPRRALRSRRDSVPLHQVRRVDRQTTTALLRSPAIGLFAPRANELPPLTHSSRLDVPCIEETVDSAANRTIVALILALFRRTRALGERLQVLVDREPVSETRTPLGIRWPKRRQFLENIEARLKILLRLQPFVEIQRAEITAAGLTTIASDPIYSRAWSRGWRALRAGVDFSASTERLWISPSWEIYERWCFLRVGKLLAATTPAWGWHRVQNRWIGSHDDRRAELLLQPRFPANHHGVGKMWSLSKERVPDLVLKVERGGDLRFVVLDAKYRASRTNVLDAMESAHIYQDSLRIGANRPAGSLLIIPASGGAGWLENRVFQEEHRVGVHVLSPEIDASLPDLVLGVLND
jgi:hypothetical protein